MSSGQKWSLYPHEMPEDWLEITVRGWQLALGDDPARKELRRLLLVDDVDGFASNMGPPTSWSTGQQWTVAAILVAVCAEVPHLRARLVESLKDREPAVEDAFFAAGEAGEFAAPEEPDEPARDLSRWVLAGCLACFSLVVLALVFLATPRKPTPPAPAPEASARTTEPHRPSVPARPAPKRAVASPRHQPLVPAKTIKRLGRVRQDQELTVAALVEPSSGESEAPKRRPEAPGEGTALAGELTSVSEPAQIATPGDLPAEPVPSIVRPRSQIRAGRRQWAPLPPEAVALAVLARASGRLTELKVRVCATGDISNRTIDELFALLERLSKVDRGGAELSPECRQALGRILHLLPAPQRFRLQQLLELDARVRQS